MNPDLVAHLDQTAESEFQDQAPLEGDKVSHVLKQEEPRSIVVAVAEVGGNQRVLEGERGERERGERGERERESRSIF